MSPTASPTGSPGDSPASGVFSLISGSGFGCLAFACCSGVSEAISSLPRSSISGRVRRPLRGPLFTSAGLAPNTTGEAATTRPPSSVRLTDRWCPSTRQPHLPVADGVPNTLTKYQPDMRALGPFGSSSARMFSRLMTVVAWSYPLPLSPVRSRARAASFCLASSSSSRTPFRIGCLSLVCCGVKNHCTRLGLSNGWPALSRSSGGSDLRKVSAAAAIGPPAGGAWWASTATPTKRAALTAARDRRASGERDMGTHRGEGWPLWYADDADRPTRIFADRSQI